jgi:glutamate dehydrogenase (NADP+)
MDLKNNRRGRIKEYTDKYKKAIYSATDRKLDHNWLWNIKADCAFPSATQNEINAKDAANLIKNGVKVVSEGANMPSTLEATICSSKPKSSTDRPKPPMPAALPPPDWKWRRTARISWTREEVDDRLHKIMIAIHKNCYDTAEKYGTPGNLVNGANIAGFLKVANSMLDQGLV